jgi:uncharacterized protein YyaL (SSP411 family)
MHAEFRTRDLDWACELAEVLLEQFEDTQGGGFFFTARDHERLILRPKPGHDNATPSGNALAAWALGRLHALTGDARYASAARRAVELFFPAMRDYPAGFAAMAIALDEQLAPPSILILRGNAQALAGWQADLARQFLPDSLVLGIPDGLSGLPAPLDKPARPGPVNAWLCRGVTCLEPMGDLVHLKKALKENA